MQKLKLSALALLFIAQLSAQTQPNFYSKKASLWADSVLSKMPIEDKLGQLFMVAAYSNKDKAHELAITKLIEEQKIGGLIFFQGGPYRQAVLTNTYQRQSKLPLMIGIDGEWGLAMRLDSTFKFAWNMTMGAVQDSALIYKVGYEMGLQHKRLGVHVNFAPVLDINTNPKNPIINVRSFGEDKNHVTTLSLAMMRGMQDAGILACGKHFPGHGDTDVDSHKSLPVVAHSKERLYNVELFPYKKLIKQGMASVMIAHLSVPALDSTGQAASLSKPIVTDLLQTEFGFNGLIFTDALNMKGVSAKYAPGIVDVEAFKAGNDILLFAENVPLAKTKMLDALANKEITIDEVNRRVHKILMAKYFLGLTKTPTIDLKNLSQDLNSTTAQILQKKVMEEALTLLVNQSAILPIKDLAGKKIAVVQMGKNPEKLFVQTLNLYTKVDAFVATENNMDLLNKLSAYDVVLVSYHTDNASPWKSYKLEEWQKAFVKKISLQNKFILTVFANPYCLANFPEAALASGLIMAYQNNAEANVAAAELIFGARTSKGRLPVSATKLFSVGYGQQSVSLGRLRQSYPEEVGIDSKKLMAIDRLANNAIAQNATPGCQILIAKEGQIIYYKGFGYHTYEKKIPVQTTDVYDLASITKIGASLPMIMKMYEAGKIDLDATLGSIYPAARGTNKENLRIRDILAHQSGLPAWLPFYVKTIKNSVPDPAIYNATQNDTFSLAVTDHLYMKKEEVRTMYDAIFAAPLGAKDYKYSDLGYYFYKEIVETEYKKPLDVVVAENFYNILGATTLTYNPYKTIALDRIPPTEQDKYFRFEAIQGYVHDQGAAMMGGIGGHAGLFSNSLDLAKLMQMYLQFGVYGGTRFLDSATVAEFIRCQFCAKGNRRGAGFDKPQLSGAGPTCDCVSLLSFGHTGFTGTIAWSDPKEKIVYIFLSNRTWPDAENRKLIQMDTRSDIQQIIYDALNTYKR